MPKLEHKKILITGAALGLGRELTKLFASHKCDFDLIDIRKNELDSLAAELQELNCLVRTHQIDLSDQKSVEDFSSKIFQEKKFDLYVFNAAIVHGGSFLNSDAKKHRNLFEVNYFSIADFLQKIIPLHQKKEEACQILIIASIAGFLGFPHAATYGASKWAIFGLVEALRLELQDRGLHHIQICVVCPSYIGTGMFEGAKTPPFLPFIQTSKLALKIVRSLETGREVLFYPAILKFIPFIRGILPYSVWCKLLRLVGVQNGMKSWRGRQQ